MADLLPLWLRLLLVGCLFGSVWASKTGATKPTDMAVWLVSGVAVIIASGWICVLCGITDPLGLCDVSLFAGTAGTPLISLPGLALVDRSPRRARSHTSRRTPVEKGSKAMTIKVTIDTSEHGGVPLKNEQLSRIRAALGDPKAEITERRGKLPGKTTFHAVQSVEDALVVYPALAPTES